MTLRLETVGTTGSTNADLRDRARAGAAEGLWLRAEQQTAGRGRQGRAWTSEPGNLFASTLVRQRPQDPPAPTLALVAAVALEEAVTPWLGAARATIKWPNDLLVDGAKLSGILLERSDDAVVVGFGVNLAHAPDDLDRAVTSVAALTGAAPPPGDVLADLAVAFAHWLGRWRQDGLAVVRARWIARAHPVGIALSVRMADSDPLDGLFDGLEADGALRLKLAETVKIVHAGDVFLP